MEIQSNDSTFFAYETLNETDYNETWAVVPESTQESIHFEKVLGLDSFRMSQFKLHIFYATLGLFGAFGVAGNALSFITFQKNSRHTSTLFLLKALALASISTLLTFIPCSCLLVHLLLKDDLYLFSVLTLFAYPLSQVALLLVTWVTVLIAVTRYIAVCHPLRASALCTVPNVARGLVIVTISAVLFQVPVYIGYQVTDVDIGNDTYTVLITTDIGAHPLFTPIFTFLYIGFNQLVPCILMCVLFTKTAVSLHHTTKHRAHMMTRQQRHENHVTRVLVPILLLFTACQVLPYVLAVAMAIYRFSLSTLLLLHFVLHPCIISFYASTNFMNYVILNSNFRSSMLDLLFCRFHQKSKSALG